MFKKTLALASALMLAALASDAQTRITVPATNSEIVSIPLESITSWDGLGRMTHEATQQVADYINRIHAQGKKVHFTSQPDTKTAWNILRRLGADYLTSARPDELTDFMNSYEANTYSAAGKFHPVYRPTYKNDGAAKAPKNVILLISDGGAGQGQMWAAATANGGNLNLLQIKNMGLVKTNSADDYTTDSAAAGTALATGRKTRNRRIGTDTLGHTVKNLPELLSARGVRTAVVSNDLLTGATPSAYFAHQPERNMSAEIAADLLTAAADLIIAAPVPEMAASDSLLANQLRAKGVAVCSDPAQLGAIPASKRAVCLKGDEDGYRLIEATFPTVTSRMAGGKKGFFAMIEGAKIDKRAHDNNFRKVVDEYLSFDRLVGQALRYADTNGETLVIVLSDHETGGLTLLDGDYTTGTVTGNFFTTDHTGVPSLLYAYGPGAQHFRGLTENTDIFEKILKIYK